MCELGSFNYVSSNVVHHFVQSTGRKNRPNTRFDRTNDSTEWKLWSWTIDWWIRPCVTASNGIADTTSIARWLDAQRDWSLNSVREFESDSPNECICWAIARKTWTTERWRVHATICRWQTSSVFPWKFAFATRCAAKWWWIERRCEWGSAEKPSYNWLHSSARRAWNKCYRRIPSMRRMSIRTPSTRKCEFRDSCVRYESMKSGDTHTCTLLE